MFRYYDKANTEVEDLAVRAGTLMRFADELARALLGTEVAHDRTTWDTPRREPQKEGNIWAVSPTHGQATVPAQGEAQGAQAAEQ